MTRRLKRALSTAWYWLRTHTINRYHIIDLRSPKNGYSWGWIDRSDAVLYACMNILVDFVENEKAFTESFVDWDSDDQHRNAKKELLEIYEWWKHGRAEAEQKNSELFDLIRRETPCDEFIPVELGTQWISHVNEHPRYQEWFETSTRNEEMDDVMLRRLVEWRGFMWT